MPFACSSTSRRFSCSSQRCAFLFWKKSEFGRRLGFYVFPAKKPAGGGGVHCFERLDRLSLPRRAGRCADDACRSDARRFPPPWSIDELEACFVVKDVIALQ
jgi:hypothetical protein